MPTRSHSASHTTVHDNQDNYFNANNWLVEANELQALDDLPVPLSTFALLVVQKYDQFCHLILATKASDNESRFNEGDDGLLQRRHLSIPGF